MICQYLLQIDETCDKIIKKFRRVQNEANKRAQEQVDVNGGLYCFSFDFLGIEITLYIQAFFRN